MKSLIIDIQRCSIHDGPGIRTSIFLKGCPLNCQWCHNPESQSFQKQLSFNSEKCTLCRGCANICSNNVHTFNKNTHFIDFSKCVHCEKCVAICTQKALHIIGKEYSPQEVLTIVLKDEIFYMQGGGGITISGGEALSHTKFCVELLTLCKEKNIHTCIETSCFTQQKNIEKIINYVDLFLIDFKTSNSKDSIKYIGQDNKLILENLDFIYTQGKEIIIRCPIIPTVNDTKEHFDEIIALSTKYPNIKQFELLPYHNFGISKAKNTNLNYKEFPIPSTEQKNEWLAYLQTEMQNRIRLA